MLLSTPTFGQPAGGVYPGAANSAVAYVSPVVMSELMYDPPAATAAEQAAGYTDNDQFEFLELYNRSATPQTLTNYYLGSGVGFTFGWYADGTPGESWTLESGATATWNSSPQTAGTYTVYADYSLTDPDGNPRTVDAAAQYTITYPGGSTTVTADQSTAVNGQLSLGNDHHHRRGARSRSSSRGNPRPRPASGRWPARWSSSRRASTSRWAARR